MTATSNVTTFDSMLKDLFPPPGEPVKEWVLKARAERAELERTGKRVRVEPHDDNTGAPCREVGPASLVADLFNHDCCSICGEHGDRIGRIDSGDLPRVLEGADWRLYRGPLTYADNLAGFARALGAIAYVRMQGFERDADASDQVPVVRADGTIEEWRREDWERYVEEQKTRDADPTPAPANSLPTEHEADCAVFGKAHTMDNRTILAECTCPIGNL